MRLLLCGGGCGEQTVLANQKLNEITDHTKPYYEFENCIKKEIAV